jgi:hypothetical protein
MVLRSPGERRVLSFNTHHLLDTCSCGMLTIRRGVDGRAQWLTIEGSSAADVLLPAVHVELWC